MKFKSDIEVQAGLRDSLGSIGTSGQVLSSTGSNVSWINQNEIAHTVSNEVKAGVAINKGQAVYVTGADGTNIIVGLASNTSEATSSKTLGLIDATVAINGFANVVEIGRLAGLNTIGANTGDPVWLGVNGNLIYGLANKPYAPAHLVFIGIVTRVNANNGEIFVNVQNGFELKEIHDVDIITNVPINGDVLGYDGTLWVNKTIAEWLGYTPAPESGSANYIQNQFASAQSANMWISGNVKATGDFEQTGNNVFVNTSYDMYLQTNASGTGIIFRTSGATERMRITSTGNVGIGTTSPNIGGWGKAVTLQGTGNAAFEATDGTVRTSLIAAAGSAGYVSTDTDHPLLFRTNSAERMRITNTGNVGIGTTSPNEKLEVLGAIRLTRTDDTAQFCTIQSTSVSGFLSTSFRPYAGAGLYGEYRFDAKDSTGGTITPLYINTLGNIGIGTTSPTQKLEVIGTSYFSNDIYVGANKGIFFSGNGAYNTGIYSSGGDFLFQTSGVEKMRLNSSGNVGIGTSSPGDKLVISGTNVFARVSNSSAGDGGIKISYQNSDTHGLHLLYNPGSAISYIDNTYPISSGQVYGDVYFRQNVGGTMTPRLSIKADSGNVGIGTTGPVSSLQVSKDQAADTAITVTNAGTVGSTTSMSFVLQEAGTPLGWFRRYRDGSGLNEIGFSNDLSFSGNIATTKVERMRIAASGNVGIGTSSPGDALEVNGNVFANGFNSIGTLTRYNTLGGVSMVGLAGNPYAILQAYSDAGGTGKSLAINPSGGNVGIGTNSPGYKLDVNGTISNNSAQNIIYASYDAVAALFQRVGTYGPIIQIGRSGVSNSTTIDYPADGTFAVSTAGSEKMRITSSGNVGIGTSSPYSKLDVSGAISMNGAYFAANNATYTQIYKAQSNSVGLYIGGAGDPQNYYDNTQHFFRSSGGGATYAIIDSSGNVGIGTTSPAQKLDVVGNIKVGDGGGASLINFNASSYGALQIGGSTKLTVNTGVSVGSSYGTTAAPSDGMIIQGNVGIGTTSPNAKLDVNGDALINQLTIGQGPVVGQGNTALGKGALGSMVGGKANIAVGSNANSDNDVTGLTVIGVDLNVNPAGSALTQNSLVIGQYNALNYSTQYPHIYAPDKVNCPNGNTTTDVIAVDYSVYTAIFMEYSIFNSAGDQFRAGTYTAAFKSTGTVVDDDNQTVVYSGTTLSATFTTSISGSVATIQLRNQDSDTYDIRVTARLLMR